MLAALKPSRIAFSALPRFGVTDINYGSRRVLLRQGVLFRLILPPVFLAPLAAFRLSEFGSSRVSCMTSCISAAIIVTATGYCARVRE